MINKYTKISKCRLCNSKLRKVIDLKNTCIGNNLEKSLNKSISQIKFPLDLYNCINCNHYQLGISVDPNILYASNYTYLSGIGKTFINHFKSYSSWIIKKAKLNKKDLIVDIGSNDGTCLKFFKKKGYNVCGIDPAKLPAKIANQKNIFTINKFYNDEVNNYIIKRFGYPSLITSHNVLAHIEDIQGVFINIYTLLKMNGYFCFEIGYFKKVLENNYLDTIYHEHLDYHHANPLVTFLNKIGFSVISLNENKIQGGSLRILCRKQKNIKNTKKVSNFIKGEKKSILFNYNKILSNFDNFNKNIIIVRKKILILKKEKKKIIGYGAPTKATLLSKLLKLNSKLINFTLDDNKLKIKKYIPGTDIFIKNLENIDINSFNFIFLYAWNFEKDIIDKLKKRKSKKSKIYVIVPLPKMKIYEI